MKMSYTTTENNEEKTNFTEVNGTNGKVLRFGKLVQISKYANTKLNKKVRIAPSTYIWVENF